MTDAIDKTKLAVALAVYAAQVAISAVWLSVCNYGPLEWLWRMWNYNKYLPIRK